VKARWVVRGLAVTLVVAGLRLALAAR